MKNVRIISIILVALMLLGSLGTLGACSLIKVDEKKDREQVIAEANGEKVKKWEFTALYNYQKAMYGITDEGENDPELKAALDGLKEGLLEDMAQQALLISKAKEAGFTLDKEILDETKKELEEQIKSQADYLKSLDEANDVDTKDKDYMKDARKGFENQLEIMKVSEDEYIEMIAKSKLIDLLYDETVKNITASDAEIKDYYDAELKKQKENDQPDSFVTLFEPDRRRAKHILIKLPDEEVSKYQELVASGKKDEAEEYLEEKLPAIKPLAEEVLEKAKAGENFEELIKTYGKDPVMENEQYKEGYVFGKGENMDPNFEEAAFKLEVDEISDLVSTGYGYHIIKLYEIIPEKTYDLSEKKDEIKTVVEGNKKNQKFQQQIDEWEKSANVKTYKNKV